ncbi:hypothetical protein EDC94DRAFT_583303 [Helicostylum pulchrum]|nr:hypothetical protein EDC94DRAFT_583303 [Helicostylum pulchrum]
MFAVILFIKRLPYLDVSREGFVNVALGALLLQPCPIKGIGCEVHSYWIFALFKVLIVKPPVNPCCIVQLHIVTTDTLWSTVIHAWSNSWYRKLFFYLVSLKSIITCYGARLKNSISITLISESFYRKFKLMVAIYFKHRMAVKIDLAVNVDVEKVTYFSFFRFKQKIEHNLMALVSKSAILLHSQSYSQKLSYNGAISCIVIWLGVKLLYLQALEDEIGALVNRYTYHFVSVNNAIYIQKSHKI